VARARLQVRDQGPARAHAPRPRAAPPPRARARPARSQGRGCWGAALLQAARRLGVARPRRSRSAPPAGHPPRAAAAGRPAHAPAPASPAAALRGAARARRESRASWAPDACSSARRTGRAYKHTGGTIMRASMDIRRGCGSRSSVGRAHVYVAPGARQRPADPAQLEVSAEEKPRRSIKST